SRARRRTGAVPRRLRSLVSDPTPLGIGLRAMERGLLGIYLRDHFAASAGGLALARRALGPNHSLTIEIARDRQSLEHVMRKLGIAPNRLKVGLVRLAERAGRLKLN